MIQFARGAKKLPARNAGGRYKGNSNLGAGFVEAARISGGQLRGGTESVHCAGGPEAQARGILLPASTVALGNSR